MSSDSQKPMIRVEDLTTYYGERRILDRANLEVQAGETMVILT
jgi:ABC-type transporter Mla maintaining outer membrane lipid asymmetry ATPase subunit MlaF